MKPTYFGKYCWEINSSYKRARLAIIYFWISPLFYNGGPVYFLMIPQSSRNSSLGIQIPGTLSLSLIIMFSQKQELFWGGARAPWHLVGTTVDNLRRVRVSWQNGRTDKAVRLFSRLVISREKCFFRHALFLSEYQYF